MGEKKSVRWGEGTPTLENYSPGLACNNQECVLYGRKVKNFDDVVVGIKEAPISMQDANRHYALICECPKCLSQFWFHISDQTADLYKEERIGI